MSSYKNCTAVVKTLLCEGTLSYKAIANEARRHFPDAQTSDKSVASIARDMRKAGKLIKTMPMPVPEALDEQLDMFNAFEASEFQLTLI